MCGVACPPMLSMLNMANTNLMADIAVTKNRWPAGFAPLAIGPGT
jgi:hypothetical protein